MDKYIITSALIINNKNQILLVKHKPEFGSDYYWFIPGGTANQNEQIFDALKREIKEETNIDVYEIKQPIYTVQHTNYKRGWYSDIYVYKIKSKLKKVKINEKDSDIAELKWFNKEQGLKHLKAVPFRVMREPLVSYLKNKKSKNFGLLLNIKLEK